MVGALAVLWGSWQALQAERLKLLAAYSPVAQLGYLFLFFPLLLALPTGPAFQEFSGPAGRHASRSPPVWKQAREVG